MAKCEAKYEHVVFNECNMDPASPSSNGSRHSCKVLFIPDSQSQYFPSESSEVYGFLMATAVIELLSCPFTVFLNRCW